MRTLPRPPRPDRRRLRPRPADRRRVSRRAARGGPLLARRADARRGLQPRLVRPEQDVRARRHLQRLPRPALAAAEGARQRGLRAMPPPGEVRRRRPPPPSGRLERRGMRGVPHAFDDLHGRRPAPRPQPADPAARAFGQARHAQCLQQLPHGQAGAMGCRCGAGVVRPHAGRLSDLRRGVRGSVAPRDRRPIAAAEGRRRPRAAGDRPGERARTPRARSDADRDRARLACAERSRRAGAPERGAAARAR